MEVIGLRAIASVGIVLLIAAVLAVLARRGAFAALRSRSRTLVVETALPLGERRSLVIVEVEGRRLLLGMTPMSVSLVTELDKHPFVDELAKQGGHS